jgi:[protein-PII] uridylyltransferase
VKRPSPQNGRVEVQFEDNPKYTIIDVYGPDTVGALYRITETLSRLGLDIYFAKIATRVDGILDAFYTLDRSGRPLESHLHPGVREEIMKLLNSLMEEELA